MRWSAVTHDCTILGLHSRQLAARFMSATIGFRKHLQSQGAMERDKARRHGGAL